MFVILSIREEQSRYDRWGEYDWGCDGDTKVFKAKNEDEAVEILTERLLEVDERASYLNIILENFDDIIYLANTDMSDRRISGPASIQWADFYEEDERRLQMSDRIEDKVTANLLDIKKKKEDEKEAAKIKAQEEANEASAKKMYEIYVNLKKQFEPK